MMFPMHTIAVIDPSWRTFNWDYVGGMMDFQGKATFIDTRFDSFEHTEVLGAVRRHYAGSKGARSAAEKPGRPCAPER